MKCGQAREGKKVVRERFHVLMIGGMKSEVYSVAVENCE